MRVNLSVLPEGRIGAVRIRPASTATSMDSKARLPQAASEGEQTMHLAHAVAAAGLAARTTERRFTTTEAEIREAERRVVERRMARVAASGRREYPERGRHAAPRPASA
jgi:hypothetical protein